MGETTRETGSSKKEKRHTNDVKHQYDYLADCEIQSKLLDIGEIEGDKNLTSTVTGAVTYNNALGLYEQPQQKSSAKSRTVTSQVHHDDFGGWSFADGPLRVTKPPEKITRNSTRIRDYRDSFGRDWKTKEIPYDFRYHDDRKKYIIQYRNNHTYSHVLKEARGSRPGSGTPIVIPPMLQNSEDRNMSIPDQAILNRQQQLPPRLKMEYMQTFASSNITQSNNSGTPKPLLTTDNKSQSESSILELQHKYKFDPDVLKAATANVNEAEELDSTADSESYSIRSRGGSARSIRSSKTSAKGRTPVAHLNPIKHGVPLRHAPGTTPLAHTPPSPHGPQPVAQPPSITGHAPFFAGKTVKHTPSNGYAIDGQTL